MRKINPFVMLFVILILGTIVRVYDLSNNPPGFFADEVVNGRNSYTILTKGTDDQNNHFPLIFKAFDTYLSPVAIYAGVPFIALFGLTDKAVRLTSVFFGVISILAIYFFTKCLLKDNPKRNVIALFSALFLAISPWHIHFSRIGWDGYMSSIMFVLIGLYVFLKALENPKLLPLSAFIFGVALYTYIPIRIFVPLFGLGLVFIYPRFFWSNKKIVFISALLLFVVIFPLAYDFFQGGLYRWKQVNIFSHPPEDKKVYTHIAHNYLSHFSMDFLFLKGDIDMPGQSVSRHSVRGIGELYLFQLPLIILGFFMLWKKPYKRILAIMSLWLLLYPLGCIFTDALSAQANRSLIGVIPFQILAAIGLGSLFSYKYKRETKNIFLSIAISIIIIISFSQYLNLYFVDYKNYTQGLYGWQFGPRDISQYFMSVENEYDQLLMTHTQFNAPDVFIPFYSEYNKKGCSKCGVGNLDVYNPDKKQLFAIAPYELEKTELNATFVTKKTIYHPNGNVAFLIGTIPNKS